MSNTECMVCGSHKGVNVGPVIIVDDRAQIDDATYHAIATWGGFVCKRCIKENVNAAIVLLRSKTGGKATQTLLDQGTPKKPQARQHQPHQGMQQHHTVMSPEHAHTLMGIYSSLVEGCINLFSSIMAIISNRFDDATALSVAANAACSMMARSIAVMRSWVGAPMQRDEMIEMARKITQIAVDAITRADSDDTQKLLENLLHVSTMVRDMESAESEPGNTGQLSDNEPGSENADTPDVRHFEMN